MDGQRRLTNLKVFPWPEQTLVAVAENFSSAAARACREWGRFVVVLAGGQTPKALYHLLAHSYHDRIEWPKVVVFFSDERWVPHSDPGSNFRMVRESLLDHVPIPKSQIFPFPTEGISLVEAARLYEQQITDFFQGTPNFDWTLLGLGEDGHTASLFPLVEIRKLNWVATVESAPKTPPCRLTLTFEALNQSESVVFLVLGGNKAEAVARVVSEPGAGLPAQKIHPRGQVCWYLDREAAARIHH